MRKRIEYFFGDRGFFSEFNHMCFFYDWAQKNNYNYTVNSCFWFNDQKINLNRYFVINEFICKTNLPIYSFYYYYTEKISRKIFKIFRVKYREKHTKRVNLNLKKNPVAMLIYYNSFGKKSGPIVQHLGEENFVHLRRESLHYMEEISIENITSTFNHLWKFNDDTAKKIELSTPDILKNNAYIAIHVRRGDKLINEDRLYQISEYFDVINEQCPDIKTIFVMTDDIAVVSEIKEKYPEFTCVSLVSSTQKGYDNAENYALNYEERSDSLLQLWTEVEIAKMSSIFLGSSRSNIYEVICYLRNNMSCYNLVDRTGNDLIGRGNTESYLE